MPVVKKWQLDEHESESDIHHREWGWVDEPTWDHCPFLPLAHTGGCTKHGSFLIQEAGWYIQDPCVLYDPEDSVYPYKMYVVKYRQENGNWRYYFHRYKSADGVSWTDEGVLKYNTTDFSSANLGLVAIRSPSVVIDSDAPAAQRWKMWFSGWIVGTAYVRYCYSSDGLNFSTPVNVISGATWQYGCPVLRLGNLYLMLLPDTSWDIHLLDSGNGTTWYDQGVVVARGGVGSWDEGLVRDPSLVYVSGVFYALYSGRNADATLEQSGMAFGLFTSATKLLDFRKYVRNPVVQCSGAGAFDSYLAGQPRILMVGRRYLCYYTAWNHGGAGTMGITRATIP